MQVENKVNTTPYKTEASTFLSKVLTFIKRGWLFILITVIVFGALGILYSNQKKPIYTARERAMVIARVSGQTVNNFNATLWYLPTIQDMASQGVVLDRADFYYQKYIESSFYQQRDINGFVSEIETISYHTAGDKRHFSASNVNVSYSVELDSTWITVAYSDTDKSSVLAKSKILTAALAQELKLKTEDREEEKYTYLSVNIEDWGSSGVYSNTSRKKTITVFLFVGLLVGVGLAYIISLFERTIKTEPELEALTGVQNLASIRAEKGGV